MKGLDIEIDKLTNSIESSASGEVFNTLVVRITMADRTAIRKKDWRFDWKAELVKEGRLVHGLVTVNEPTVIQGLMSMEDRRDHIFLHLIESAKANMGKGKKYAGVPGNLVAFACRESLASGHDGVVSFVAKTKLIVHYQNTLGARSIGGGRMTIDPPKAFELIQRYFKTT
jgi:hypothetical protein